ncbi:MAG: TonB family protein [Acidobacteriota bacterium]|nr:TonB family protein [Acidobacteriota bacterium]
MSGALKLVQGADPSNDRRQHARLRALTLTYAELDQDNGGIVLDASEGGISVHAVVPLTDDFLPKLRLKLPESGWLEAGARVVWTRDSRKVAGLQFEDLSNEAKAQISSWLSSEAAPPENTEVAGPPKHGLQSATESVPAVSESTNGDRVEPARAIPDMTAIAGTASHYSRPMPAVEPSAGSVESRIEWTNPLVPAPPRQVSTRSFLPKGPRRTASSVYLLLLTLAVASLASGWAAGTGKLRPLVEKVRAAMRPSILNGRVVASQSVQQAPPIREIEIVDNNNQRRKIPLLAAPSAVPHSAPSAPAEKLTAAKNPTAPNDKPRMNFQIWTLTPPQTSPASQMPDASRDAGPPDLGTYSGSPQISAMESGPIAVAGPEAPPKPRISSGVLKRGTLIHRVDPVYPQIAQEQHILGTVTLQATVAADGTVRDVHVISGSKLLAQPAVNAVRQWRYTPTLLDGKAIQTQVQISLVFGQPND